MKGKYFHRSFVLSMLPTNERKHMKKEDGDWVPLWWVADQCDANWTSPVNMPLAVAEKLLRDNLGEVTDLLPDAEAQALVRSVLNYLVVLGQVERIGSSNHFLYRKAL